MIDRKRPLFNEVWKNGTLYKILGGTCMKFCECGSLVVNGSCTNKKCKHAGPTDSKVTWKQEDLIKELSQEEYDFSSMTKREASEIINELLKEVN